MKSLKKKIKVSYSAINYVTATVLGRRFWILGVGSGGQGPSKREGKKLEQISPRKTVHGPQARQRKR